MATTHFVNDYRRLRRATAFTGIADGMIAVGLPLLVVGLTNNPIAIAGVMATQHLPWVGFEFFDINVRAPADRRTILGLANTLRALMAVGLGGLSIINKETLPLIYLAALVFGLGEASTDEAEDETLDILLDESAASDARSSLRSLGMAGIGLVGLPLGGLLYSVVAGAPFMVAMVAYALGGIFALFVKTAIAPSPNSKILDGRAPDKQVMPRSARPVVIIASITAGATSAVLGVFVFYITNTLGLTAPAYGFILAGLAASSFLGSQLAPSIGHRLGLSNAISVVLAVSGIGYGITSLLTNGTLIGALLPIVIASGGAMCAGVLLRAAFQAVHLSFGKSVGSNALRTFHLATWAAICIGAFMGGLIVKLSGFPTLFLITSGFILVCTAMATALQTKGSPSG